jgi:hypothetical protein
MWNLETVLNGATVDRFAEFEPEQTSDFLLDEFLDDEDRYLMEQRLAEFEVDAPFPADEDEEV